LAWQSLFKLLEVVETVLLVLIALLLVLTALLLVELVLWQQSQSSLAKEATGPRTQPHPLLQLAPQSHRLLLPPALQPQSLSSRDLVAQPPLRQRPSAIALVCVLQALSPCRHHKPRHFNSDP
jgi:hypothetical protein